MTDIAKAREAAAEALREIDRLPFEITRQEAAWASHAKHLANHVTALADELDRLGSIPVAFPNLRQEDLVAVPRAFLKSDGSASRLTTPSADVLALVRALEDLQDDFCSRHCINLDEDHFEECEVARAALATIPPELRSAD